MRKRILIIDNDTLLNKVNEKVLVSSGIVSDLTIVPHGKQGIEHLKNCIAKNLPLPDLIIMDVQLPIMNGFEFLEAFRKMNLNYQWPPIEIIIFTASNNIRERQRLADLGIRHFISKPYLLRGLMSVISNMNTGYGNVATSLPLRVS